MRSLFLLVIASGMLPAVDSADWIERLGGQVTRDRAGKIVGVNLRGTWVNDADMLSLAAMPDLETLDLSHTRITRRGDAAAESGAEDQRSEPVLFRVDHRSGNDRDPRLEASEAAECKGNADIRRHSGDRQPHASAWKRWISRTPQ